MTEMYLIDELAWLIREKWADIAATRTACDRSAAEAAVRRLYRAAGLGAPEIRWTGSAAELFTHWVCLPAIAGQERPRPVTDLCWQDPRHCLGDWPVLAAVRYRVDDALAGAVWPVETDRLGQQIWQQVAGEPLAEAGVLSVFGHCEQAILWDCYLNAGQIDDPVLEATLDVLEHSGWCLFLDGQVVLAERAEQLRADGQGQLHQARYPAVSWPDGRSLNSWHGTGLPDDIWQWTVNDALAWPLAWQRDVFLQVWGWLESGQSLTPVAVADDPANLGQVIELVRLTQVDNPAEVRGYVVVTNASVNADGSRNRYAIEVPPQLDDPVAAVAQTFGLDAHSYRQLARAC